MKKNIFNIKNIIILLTLTFSNMLLANENIAEIAAEHSDEFIEAELHTTQQNLEPESWSSWINNNIEYYFSNANKIGNEAYVAGGVIYSNIQNIPNNVKENFAKRMQEIGYYTPTQNKDVNTQGNYANIPPVVTTQGNYTNIPPVTIVMQDRNVAQMSGEDFINTKIKMRKNITHIKINNDDNIRNVNLKLHSLYMSNYALSR
jgi:hypothetical protein